jgi:hypothetical protein
VWFELAWAEEDSDALVVQGFDASVEGSVAGQCLVDEGEYDDPYSEAGEFCQLGEDVVVCDAGGPFV